MDGKSNSLCACDQFSQSDRWASPIFFVPGTLGANLGYPSIASKEPTARTFKDGCSVVSMIGID